MFSRSGSSAAAAGTSGQTATLTGNSGGGVSANSSSAAPGIAGSPQPPPDLIGSLMLSSSGILDALLQTNSASAPPMTSSTNHLRSYTNNFLPTDFYRPLSGTLPRRRYSFGGLPDFGEQQISNLLNETSRSISRSMQILCDNRENIDLCEIKKALDIDPRPELMNGMSDQSNLLPMGTNFFSHPNIFSPAAGGGYGTGQLKYQSPSAAAGLFEPSPTMMPLQCQLATGSGPLFTSSSSTAGLNCYAGGGGGYDNMFPSPHLQMGGMGRRAGRANVNYLLSKPGGGLTYPYTQQPFNNNATASCYLPPSSSSNYFCNANQNYPWATNVGSPLSLNQRLMAGLDCASSSSFPAYPSTNPFARNSMLPPSSMFTMNSAHYGSHPSISKYSNASRNAFASHNYFPHQNNASSAMNTTGGGPCYPYDPMSSYSQQNAAGYYNNNNNHNNNMATYNHHHHQPANRGLYGSGFQQHPPRSLPLSYYPGYKSGGYYGTRHGGGAFNANSLSRVGNSSAAAAAAAAAAASDMKRQVSFKFDVDQLSIGS